MPNIVNVDHWDWVDPDNNKVTRLRRGDELPSRVLEFVEDGGESMFQGPRPVLLKTDDPAEAGPKTVAAETSQGNKESQTPAPRGAEKPEK